MKCFLPLEGNNSETTQLKTLNSIAKAPTVEHLRLKTLRETKTVFCTLKRYNEHPRQSFLNGSPSQAGCPINEIDNRDCRDELKVVGLKNMAKTTKH